MGESNMEKLKAETSSKPDWSKIRFSHTPTKSAHATFDILDGPNFERGRGVIRDIRFGANTAVYRVLNHIGAQGWDCLAYKGLRSDVSLDLSARERFRQEAADLICLGRHRNIAFADRVMEDIGGMIVQSDYVRGLTATEF